MTKNRWDQSFSTEDYVYGVTVNKFIQQMSDHVPRNAKIAFFAEGEGRNAVYMAKQGHQVTAYDQSTVGLAKAKQLARKNNVEIDTVATNLTKQKVGKEQYDAVLMVFGHVHKDNQQFLFNHMIEAVKPGGHVIVEVYSEAQLPYQTGGPQTIDHLYDPTDILNWTKDMKVIHFYYGEAIRNEGKRHTGLCHVIQLVIKK